MAEMVVKVKICNIVASVDFGRKIALSNLLKTYPTLFRRKKHFPGLVLRLKNPKTANLVFRTGKMICTGLSSELEVPKTVRKVTAELKRRGVKLDGKPEVKIQNIVALVNFGRNINLEKVSHSLVSTIYEPEQFPGLICRIDEPKTVALLFSNGKAVLTGAKTKSEVHKAARKLERDLFGRGLESAPEVKDGEIAVPEDVDGLKILTTLYSLCEFCTYDCGLCPYPGLGVFLEKVDRETLAHVAKLTRIEACKGGVFAKPIPSLSSRLRALEVSLDEFFRDVLQNRWNAFPLSD